MIYEYNGFLEAALGSDGFERSLDGYETFIKYDDDYIIRRDPNEGGQKGLIDYPEL